MSKYLTVGSVVLVSKRYVEDRAGMFERVKYENPKIGENFYVFKNLINKEL